MKRILDFEGLASGDVISDQFADLGVSISTRARRSDEGGGDAMIFDTNNVTGGDTDLSFENQGNALIISEDGDGKDADDNRFGGKVRFDFDDEVDIDGLTLLDVEERAVIRAFDADGNLVGRQVVRSGEDNKATLVELNFEGVARLEVKLNGSGAIDDLVFRTDDLPPPPPPDPVSDSETVVLDDGTEATFEIETPGAVTTDTSTISGSFQLGAGGDNVNVLYVVDVSGSTALNFFGDPVGDANGDLVPDTVLDAEIQSLLNLTAEIDALGLAPEDIDIGLVSFNSFGRTIGTFDPGTPELETALTSLRSGGNTNFEAPLQNAVDFFTAQNEPGAQNILYFLSDGFGGGLFQDEVDTLTTDLDVEIVAIGVGSGSDLTQLNAIDNTGGAEIVTSTNELDVTLTGSAIEAEIVDFMVFVNNVEQTDIDESDLVETPFGLELAPTTISGLDPTLGATNDVSAVLELDDGTRIELDAVVTGAGFEFLT